MSRRRNLAQTGHPDNLQGSMLWSQFSAIFFQFSAENIDVFLEKM
jgi:hypothetical protein